MDEENFDFRCPDSELKFDSTPAVIELKNNNNKKTKTKQKIKLKKPASLWNQQLLVPFD